MGERPTVQQNPDPTSSAPADPKPAADSDQRNVLVHGTFVRLMIATAVLLTAGIASLIYYNWARSRFPDSCIVVVPDVQESGDGVEVFVNASDGDKHQVAKVDLKGTEDLPVLVEEGDYTVTVRYQGSSYRLQVHVPSRRLVRIPITTRPSKAPMSRWPVLPDLLHPGGNPAAPDALDRPNAATAGEHHRYHEERRPG